MKKLFTLLALALCFTATAQKKVKEVVKDDYQRNSISIIQVERGDNFDSEVAAGVRAIDLGDKFDRNRIDTYTLSYNLGRGSAVSATSIGKTLNSYEVGKEIISYWFNYRPNGMMDASRVAERGNYNADDQEYKNAQVMKIAGADALGDAGWGLIKGSYVMVLDYTKIGKSKDDDGNITWEVTTNAHVFQLEYSQDLQAQIDAAWVYEEDSPEVVARKKEIYANLPVTVKYRASAQGTSSAAEKNGGLSAAVAGGYESVLTTLETLIPEWNVTSGIISRRPLKAKIGKKEGVKNCMRFRAYKTRVRNNGTTVSIPKGYIRATKVADNRGLATGNTKPSEFYQISGGRIPIGATIKQKNDIRLGVSAGYRFVGDVSPYNINLDYLASMNTKGISHYGLVNIGVDVVTGSNLRDMGLTGDDGSGVTYLDLGIGYGLGIRPIRHIELVPFIMAGGEYMMLNNDTEEESDEKFMDKMAWFGNAGLRINFNIKYPFQIFVQADYTYFIAQGALYEHNNSMIYGFSDGEHGHDHSFSLMAGIKWNF